jgi:hypothetical protein
MDKTSKIILALIATGLWANVVTAMVQPAQAQADWMGRMTIQIQSIAHDLSTLVKGGIECKNPKLCN